MIEKHISDGDIILIYAQNAYIKSIYFENVCIKSANIGVVYVRNIYINSANTAKYLKIYLQLF